MGMMLNCYTSLTAHEIDLHTQNLVRTWKDNNPRMSIKPDWKDDRDLRRSFRDRE